MEFQDGTIGRIAGDEWYQERAREYGGRAWKVFGEQVDVVYWDVGNGWSSIISVIPHDGQVSHIQEFWDALRQTDDE